MRIISVQIEQQTKGLLPRTTTLSEMEGEKEKTSQQQTYFPLQTLL